MPTYGPNPMVPVGEVGEIEIESLILNDAKNGYTALVKGGGVLSLTLTPHGQSTLRRKSREDWPEERRAKVLQVLGAWANAKGKAYKHGLEWHAENQGVPYSEIRSACYENPGRTAPPLRAEYERGLLRRRDTHNFMKSQGKRA